MPGLRRGALSVMDDARLIDTAKEYRERAYCPFSRFKVGAAVLTKRGNVYGGCNIENASYPLTNCAERTAIFKAVSEGEHEFEAIAVIADTESPCAPCGACRQVMAEFRIPRIIMANMAGDVKSVSLRELLPFAFTNEGISRR